MKNIRILFFAVVMITLYFSPQLKAVTKTASTGVWTVAGTWSPSGVPLTGDNVVIPSGITVTLVGFGNCASLNITGTLKFASGSYLNYTGNSAPVIFGQLFCTATGNTFEFSNSSTFTLPDIDFYNLLLSAGTKETDPSSERSILGNLSLTGGSLLSLYANANFYPMTIAGNVAGDGQLLLNLDNGGNATDVYVGGDYLCTGPIDLAGGNMYYYRTGISQLLQADGNGYNGSIILSGGPKVFIGDIIANDLVMNGNIVFSTTGLASSLTINNLTASGTIDMSAGGVAHYLEIDGTITGCFFLIAGTGSEVAYGYSGTQNVCPNVYNNLTLSPAGTNKILTGNTTVNGVLYLGAILSVNGNNLWIGTSGSIFNTGFGSGKKIAFSDTGNDKLYLKGSVNTDFTNKIYPLGFSGTDYEPIIIYALSAAIAPASSIGIRPVKTVLGTPYLNRMYSVTSTGISSITLFDALFTFLTTEATNFPGFVQRSTGGVVSTVIGSTITFSGAGGSPTTGAFGIHSPNNQINGDYFIQGNGPALYKSNNTSMNWSNASSWQQSFNNGVTWNTPLNYPGQLSAGDMISIVGSNVVTGDVSPANLLSGITVSGQLLTGANNYSISGLTLINSAGLFQTSTNATKTYFLGQLQNNGQFLCGVNSYQEFKNGFVNNASSLANFSPDGHTKFTTNNQTVSGSSTFSQFNGLVEVDSNIVVENQHTYIYINTNTSLVGLNANSGWQLGTNGYMYSTSNTQLMSGGILLATLPGTGVVYLGNNQKMRNTNYYDIQIGNPGVKIIEGQINTVDFGNNAGFATLSFSGAQLSTLSVTGSFYFDNPTDAVDMSGGGFAHQLYLGGLSNTITGTTTIGNSKFIYNGTASQNVIALNYSTLVFNGIGAKFLTGNTKASQLHLGMNNGMVQLGAYNLTATGVFPDLPYSSNNMIQMDGTSTAGAFFYNPATASGLVTEYPIGTGSDYTPVSITSINAASATANPIISMQLVLGTGGSGILNRFVNFSTAGINTVSNLNLFIFYIDPTDVAGAIPTGVNIYKPAKTPLANSVVLATFPNYYGQVGVFGNKIDGLWVAESAIVPAINFSGFVTTVGNSVNLAPLFTSNSPGTVTFVSSDPATGVIASGGTFVALKSGVVTITAFQAANGSYTSGSKSAVITINGEIFELLSQAGNKLFGSGSIGISAQGTSVSLSNDRNTLIIGGPNDGSSQGAAWIFNYNGTSYIDSGTKLTGTGNTGTAHQGTAVSISSDGRTAIVGGATDNSNIGAAWIFTYNGSNFVQLGSKLVGSGNAGGSYQGYAVAISGDGKTAIVGGYQDGTNQGAAWIYTFNGTNFVQAGSKLVGTGGATGDRQGFAVSISSDGTTAIVGGPNNSTGQGAVWIYTFNGSNYVQVGTKLVGSGNIGSANQGTSVSLSSDGKTVLIGGPQDNAGIGAAWIYTYNGSNFVQAGKLTGIGNVGAAALGSAVSLSSDGNTAVVGGPADNSNTGAIWIYTYNGSNFVQAGNKLTGTGSFGTPKLGSSIAISSNSRNVISGGALDNSGQGAVWVFQYLQTQTIIGFNPIPAQQLATGTYNIPGVSATSGLPITFTSSNLSIAAISGTTITFLTGGVVTITTFQPGDNVYAPAIPVSQVLVIMPDKPLGNRGMYFDAIDDNLTVSNSTSINTAVNTKSVTMAAWIKIHDTTSYFTIASSWTYTNANSLFMWGIADGQPFINEIGGAFFISGAFVPLNKWTHVAVTIDPTNITHYVNGVQAGQFPTLSYYSQAGLNVLIGATQSPGVVGQSMNGQIDELKIFNTVHTQAQIITDMASQTPDGAIAYWNFDDDAAAGNQTVAGDLSGNGNDATLTNGPLWALRVTDNTDNAGAGLGSLRQAIVEANTDFDTDYIDFSIQQNGTTSTITPTSAFPDISNPSIIDGYSANGSSINTVSLASGNNAILRVEINCATVTTNSFNMTLGASAITGLAMYSHTGSPYIISYISNLLFNGNFVGLRADGSMATGSSNGVYIAGGSAVTVTGNVIVNQSSGISIYSSNSLISGNLVGVQPTGWVEVSNGEGIINFTGTNNTISGNVIASSGYNLDLRGTGSIVKGNYIGTDPSGTLNLGTPSGAGILIQGETNSTIGGISAGEGNVIANNSNYGLWIQTGSGNKISGNSVYGNSGTNGIQLNAGANGDKPAPFITAAIPSMITGTCQAGDIVEVFNDNNSIGAPNQGRTYLGTATNISGNWSYPGTFTLGDRITATATDATNGTSAFSVASIVSPVIVPTMPVGNRGMYFNGAGDHVAVNSPVQNDFTIEFWMKTTQPGNPAPDPHWFYGFGLIDGDAGSYDYGVSMADGKIRFGSGDYSFDYTAESVTLVNDNKWHHVAVIRQSTGPVAMFIDGNPETLTGNTTQVVGALSGTPTLKIGKIQSNQFPYNGQLDEIKIFNTIRSVSEIIFDMSSTATGTAGLVSYWDFEDDAAAGDQTIAVDASSNGNDGTLTNGPLWTLRVTDMTDNTGSVGSLGSLRQAINEANTDPDKDYIDFSMPGGTQTITPGTTYNIDYPVFIDGFTQLNTLTGENSHPNTTPFGQAIDAKLNVIVNGSLIGGSSDGIDITSDNNLIRGLVLNSFSNAASTLAWTGTNSNSTISGCFFGTDRDGMITGINSNLVSFRSSGSFSQNVIGGYTNADRNLIGSGASAFNNFVNSTFAGNYFGTDAFGSNYLGDATIGLIFSNSNVFDENVIAVKLQILASDGYVISNNRFGTKADGTGYLSDGGVGINLGNVTGSQPGNNHLILNNIIANRALGVQISRSSINNTISGNSIYDNTTAGIYLTGGSPAGNNNKPVPVIVSLNSQLITGSCQSGDVVEVFSDSPQSGSTDQGRVYLGKATTATTSWSFAGSFTPGTRITATATDATNGTSPFSIGTTIGSTLGAPIANYPLLNNPIDIMGNNPDMTLTNAPYQNGGIYSNGIYNIPDPVNGVVAVTPPINLFNENSFTISADFYVTSFKTQPVIVDGSGSRWLGAYLNANGTLSLYYNNSFYLPTTTTYTLNQWHNVKLSYDGTTARIFYDDVFAGEIAITLSTASNYDIGVTNYSNSDVYEGYLKNLVVYPTPMLGSALIGLYVSTTSGSWNDKTIWSVSTDSGVSFMPAAYYPGQSVKGDIVSISGSTNVLLNASLPKSIDSLIVSGNLDLSSSDFTVTGSSLIDPTGSLIDLTLQGINNFTGVLSILGAIDLSGGNSNFGDHIQFDNDLSQARVFGNMTFSGTNQSITGIFTSSVPTFGDILIGPNNALTYGIQAPFLPWFKNISGTNSNSGFILGPNGQISYTGTLRPMAIGYLNASAINSQFSYASQSALNDQVVKGTYYYNLSLGDSYNTVKYIDEDLIAYQCFMLGGKVVFSSTSGINFSIERRFEMYGYDTEIDLSMQNQPHVLSLAGSMHVTNNSSITGSNNLASKVIYLNTADTYNNDNIISGSYQNLEIKGVSAYRYTYGTVTASGLTLAGASILQTNYPITGHVAGNLQMDAGTSLILGDPTTSLGIGFPSNYVPNNIKLDPTSTVVYGANIAQTVSNVPVYGNLVLTASGIKSNIAGSLTVTGSLTIGAGVTYSSTNDLYLSGDFVNDGTFTQSPLKLCLLNGAVDQTLGGATVTQFMVLSLNKTGGNAFLNKDIQIANLLSFGGTGNLVVGNNIVTFQTNSTVLGVPGSANMIEMNGTGGQVVHQGTTALQLDFLYPVGTGTVYSPVSITGLNALVTPTAQLGVRLINTTGGLDMVNRIYELSSSNITGISSVHVDFAYDPLSTEANGTPNTIFRYNPIQNTVESPYINLLTGHFGVNGTYTNVLDGEWLLQSSTTLTGLLLPVGNLCAGWSYPVTVMGTGLFNGGNIFGLELSASDGSFPGTSILSWPGILPNTVLGITLPAGLSSSANYKIRAFASNPSLYGRDITPLTITGIPVISSVSPTSAFPGDGLTLTGSNMSGVLGTILANGQTVTGFITTTGINAIQTINSAYTVPSAIGSIKVYNGCGTSPLSLQVLTVWPAHATGLVITIPGGPYITVSGGNLVAGSVVNPNTASPLISWSIIPANGVASIDGTGVLQALNDGVVTIIGTSVSDPTVTGIYVITIVGQAPQVISASTTLPVHLCQGQALVVPFTKTGSYLPGSFIAELYNGTTTVGIGSAAGNPGSINTTIPGGLFGTDFRIRVRHTLATGATLQDNGQDITVAGIPVLTAMPVQNICSGATTNITFTGTQNPYTFTWNLISATVGITGVYSGIGTELQQTIEGSGTLLYSVTGSNGCVSSPINLTINVHDIPTVDNPGIQAICSGNLFTLTVTSPISGVIFTWTPTVTGSVTGSSMITGNTISQTLTGQGYVNYMIIPVANGCTGPGYNLEVGVSGTPDLSLGVTLPNGNFICSTEDMSLIIQNSQIGILYNAYIGNTSIADLTDGTGGNILVTIPASSFSAGPNTIRIKAASVGCGTGFLSNTVSGLQAASPDTSFLVSVSNPNVCQGEDRAISLGGSQNGVLYAPFMGLVQVGPTVAGTGSAMDVGVTGSALPSGIDVIKVQALSPGCTGYLPFSHSTTLTVQALPTVNPVFNTRNCSGLANTIVLTSTPAGASFTWSLVGTNTTGNVTGQTSGGTGNIDQTLSGLGTVDYLVFPKIGVCAGTPKLITIRVNGQPNTSYPVKADSVCGGALATVNVGNSELGVDYRLLSGSTLVSSIAGTGGPVSLTIPGTVTLNLGSNVFSLLGVGCVSQAFSPDPNLVVLSSPVSPAVTSTLGTTATCDKQNITLSVPNTYSKYQWRMNGIKIAGEDSNAYVPVIHGTYSVEVYTGNNCFILSEIAPLEFTINQIKPVITASGGNKDTLLVSSSATGYQWYVGQRAIVGADKQTYRPYFSAAYRVRINPKGKCSEYSDDYYLNNVDYDPLVRYDFEMTDSTIVIDIDKLQLMNQLEISPNPASERFSIRYKAHKRNSVLQLTVYNSLGSLVSSQSIQTNDVGMLITEMERENLPSGIYKVVISDGDERVSANLVFR